MNSMTNSSRPSQVTTKIKHNNFSNYAAPLSQFGTDFVDNKYSYLLLSHRRLVSPTQKRKLFSDISSSTTVNTTDTKTTAKSTTYQPTVSLYATPPISWKKEGSEMMGDTKGKIMNSINS